MLQSHIDKTHELGIRRDMLLFTDYSMCKKSWGFNINPLMLLGPKYLFLKLDRLIDERTLNKSSRKVMAQLDKVGRA